MQQKLNYRGAGKYKVPVIHLVQLIALALGVEIPQIGLDAHAIGFSRFLKKFKATHNEEEVQHG